MRKEQPSENERLLVSVIKLGFKQKRVYALVAAVTSKGTGAGSTAWVPLVELRNRARWRSGWLTRAEVDAASTTRPCPAGCDHGYMPCKACGMHAQHVDGQ